MALEFFNKAMKTLRSPRGMIISFFYHTAFIWPDKIYLRVMYRMMLGQKLNLKEPQTFSEKIQWMKLYDRKPEYTVMVDKVKAKDYVSAKIGKEHIIPTLGVWSDPEEINFDELPSRFVLKINHNSGTGMYICKDKSNLDVVKVKAELKKGLKENYYLRNREWPYKDVPRRILAEEFIEPAPNVIDLPDYKWYCFDGEPKYCQVIQNRTTNETIDFFDIEWNHQNFVGLNPAAGPAAVTPSRPANLETHIRIAKMLSKGLRFARIDLYETGEKTYFGEITFYPLSGFGVFTPDIYNKLLGQMIKLPGERDYDFKNIE